MKRSCALIGNGGSARRFRLGRWIDSFEDIARINNYVTEGYEEFVGCRTTIWLKHPSPRVHLRDGISFDRVICSSPCFDRRHPDCGEFIPKQIIDEVRRWFLARGESKYPSTGLFGLRYLMEDYETVFVAGFDGFTDSHHHYFSKTGDPSPHSTITERAYMDHLIQTGRVFDMQRFDGYIDTLR